MISSDSTTIIIMLSVVGSSIQSDAIRTVSENLQHPKCTCQSHNRDVIMSAMASQITGASSVYSTVCSGADQRKDQTSASLAFVMGIHRWPVIMTLSLRHVHVVGVILNRHDRITPLTQQASLHKINYIVSLRWSYMSARRLKLPATRMFVEQLSIKSSPKHHSTDGNAPMTGGFP